MGPGGISLSLKLFFIPIQMTDCKGLKQIMALSLIMTLSRCCEMSYSGYSNFQLFKIKVGVSDSSSFTSILSVQMA